MSGRLAGRLFVTALVLALFVLAMPGAQAARPDASGSELWKALYDGPGDLWDSPVAIATSPDGAITFVTGSSWGGSSVNDYATIAYDTATGAMLWEARFNGTKNSDDLPAAKIYVTGQSFAGGHLDDWATIAYDTATGMGLWIARFDDPDHQSDYPTRIRVSPDGSHVFVSGYAYSLQTASDFVTVSYDSADGSVSWTARYDDPSHSYDFITGSGISPDGSQLFVTGVDQSGSGSGDIVTISYDTATGSVLWYRRLDDSTHSYDYPSDLTVSPDGAHVFVSGYVPRTTADGIVVAYDAATGSISWMSGFISVSGNEYPVGIAAGPDGSRVFVTGYTDGGSASIDWATAGYDAATGKQVWASRLLDIGQDSAVALTTSIDSSIVLVTGIFQTTPDGRTDFGTVAYTA